MSYLDRIQTDLKEAMKSRNLIRTRTLRMLLSKLKEKRIELGKDLSEQDELALLKKAAKERKDSAATYEDAGRKDLEQKEIEELEIINTYLPEELSDDAIRGIVREIIADTGAESIRDMGKVMGPAMNTLTGRADGKRVQMIVREELEG